MKNRSYPLYVVPQPRNLRELVDHCATTHPESVAFSYIEKGEEKHISYALLKKHIHQLCAYLNRHISAPTHIALLGENSYHWIVAYFAVVLSGNVVVPLDKELPAKDLQYLLKKGDAPALIYSKTYDDIAEELTVDCKLSMAEFAAVFQGELAQEVILPQVDDDALCTLIFTSGTTGEPKGVMLSNRNLMTDTVVSMENLYAPPGTVLLLPLHHTFGFTAGVLCQMLNCSEVFINASLKNALRDIKHASPRHVSVVPLMIEAFYNGIWSNAKKTGKDKKLRTALKVSKALRKVGIDLRKVLFKSVIDAFGGRLEMLISGGAPIDRKLIENFDALGIKITNGYGISECSPIVATMRNKHYNPESVGVVQPRIQAKIVDGEILLKGDVVTCGYYKDEAATAASFEDGWFKTGDLGRIDEKGFLYILGRKKNLIILSNGKNVSAEELEQELCHISYVKEAVAYAKNDKICAEVYLDPELPDGKERIHADIDSLNRSLPPYKNIGELVLRDTEFPKTTTKKIKRY